jgi:hypothetical protein
MDNNIAKRLVFLLLGIVLGGLSVDHIRDNSSSHHQSNRCSYQETSNSTVPIKDRLEKVKKFLPIDAKNIMLVDNNWVTFSLYHHRYLMKNGVVIEVQD